MLRICKTFKNNKKSISSKANKHTNKKGTLANLEMTQPLPDDVQQLINKVATDNLPVKRKNISPQSSSLACHS